MDLQLYLRVLWRFRVLVAMGTLLAIALAFLATFQVRFEGTMPRLEYREPEIWRSEGVLLVTQRGFPLGRTAVGEGSDPERLESLAVVYAQLARSDAVLRLAWEDGPLPGEIVAQPALAPQDKRSVLPLVEVAGHSTTPAAAVVTARRGMAALQEYLRRQQVANRIPQENRVILTTSVTPSAVELEVPRSKTRPIVILLAALMATLALAFILENLRPRVRPMVAEGDAQPLPLPEAPRRSA